MVRAKLTRCRPGAILGFTMTVALRQWAAQGGPIVLGRVVPGFVACVGLAAVTASIAIVERYGWRDGSASLALFIMVAIFATWLFWRFLRTAWLIVLADDTFSFLATVGRWKLGPGRSSPSGATCTTSSSRSSERAQKLSIWGQLDDRDVLVRGDSLGESDGGVRALATTNERLKQGSTSRHVQFLGTEGWTPRQIPRKAALKPVTGRPLLLGVFATGQLSLALKTRTLQIPNMASIGRYVACGVPILGSDERSGRGPSYRAIRFKTRLIGRW